MVRSYVNDEIEIKRFKNLIIEANILIDYNNKRIEKLKDTIIIYEQIINDLEIKNETAIL